MTASNGAARPTPEPLQPTGNWRMQTFRLILSTGQKAHVDGELVDIMAAANVVAFYDRLGPEAREAYSQLSARKMLDLAYQELRQQLRRTRRR